MNTRAVTTPVLLIGLLSLSSCNFPGLQGGGEMDVPVATPTTAPIEAPALPSPSPTTEVLDPTQEPLPVTSERIPISIDNLKELTIQTHLESWPTSMPRSIYLWMVSISPCPTGTFPKMWFEYGTWS